MPWSPRRSSCRRPCAQLGLRALPVHRGCRSGCGAPRRDSGAGHRVLRVDAASAWQHGYDPAPVPARGHRAHGTPRRRPRSLRGGRAAGGGARDDRRTWRRHGTGSLPRSPAHSCATSPSTGGAGLVWMRPSSRWRVGVSLRCRGRCPPSPCSGSSTRAIRAGRTVHATALSCYSWPGSGCGAATSSGCG